ncbi:MAG: DUF1446 domain-containing protein [Alphaproteobacteria bacterium]|nr:DUF1446 domain-containing protein [Alphaproteobacteria bacterium]
MPASGPVHIGCGAGFSGDRTDASGPVVDALAVSGRPSYLIFETLAERTLALAQLDRRRDPAAGFTPYLADFLRPVLRRCVEAKIRIVANFGAANPMAAGRCVLEVAAELGLSDLRVAVVEGDDLLATLGADAIRRWPNDERAELAGRDIIAANAYLGAQPIAAALARGADVVVTGRCTDSALVLGPLVHEFGWAPPDWDRLAAGTLAGHLIECCAQVTGGYFADPGRKDVPDLDRVGFPIVEVARDGTMVVTKPSGTGGLVSEETVTEQMLYELHDPAAYLTPDVTMDITGVRLVTEAPDRILIQGARGHPPPPTYKVTVSLDGGFLAEGEISYAGPNALARAELAAEVLLKRVKRLGINHPIRCDIIGAVSVFDSDGGVRRRASGAPVDGDYRVRLSGSSDDRTTADRIAREVLSLYPTGPAGGAGVRTSVTGRVRTVSAYVPAEAIRPRISVLSAPAG